MDKHHKVHLDWKSLATDLQMVRDGLGIMLSDKNMTQGYCTKHDGFV